MRALIAALLFASLAACSEPSEYTGAAKEITVATGNKFAAALVAGNFTEAHSLLAANLRSQYTPQKLAERYKKMIEYGTGPARLDGYYLYEYDLPTLRLLDYGWVYISIEGEDYLEAVTVVVTRENDQPRIRDIEWGRP